MSRPSCICKPCYYQKTSSFCDRKHCTFVHTNAEGRFVCRHKSDVTDRVSTLYSCLSRVIGDRHPDPNPDLIGNRHPDHAHHHEQIMILQDEINKMHVVAQMNQTKIMDLERMNRMNLAEIAMLRNQNKQFRDAKEKERVRSPSNSPSRSPVRSYRRERSPVRSHHSYNNQERHRYGDYRQRFTFTAPTNHRSAGHKHERSRSPQRRNYRNNDIIESLLRQGSVATAAIAHKPDSEPILSAPAISTEIVANTVAQDATNAFSRL